MLVGGYGGSWLSWGRASDLPLDETPLRAAGASLGAGSPRPAAPAGLRGRGDRPARGLPGRSSARQCGPCLFGLGAISAALTDLRHGTGRRSDVRRLQRWAAEVDGRGACHHPDGAVRMALTGLVAFADDVEAHRRRRPCAFASGPGVVPVPEEERVSGTRLVVDPVACDGIGMCAHLAEDLVRLDTWGYPVVPTRDLEQAEVRRAGRAVAGCPRRALRLSP